jgi:hypothetical protein
MVPARVAVTTSPLGPSAPSVPRAPATGSGGVGGRKPETSMPTSTWNIFDTPHLEAVGALVRGARIPLARS